MKLTVNNPKNLDELRLECQDFGPFLVIKYVKDYKYHYRMSIIKVILLSLHFPKLCNQALSLSLSRWQTLTLKKIKIGWVLWCIKIQTIVSSWKKYCESMHSWLLSEVWNIIATQPRGWCIKFATGLNGHYTTNSSHFVAN